jgi:hypothetical protein
MNASITAAVIISVGLVITGFLIGGRYTIMTTSTNAVTRLDRLTGEVSMCVPGAKGGACGFVLDSAPK